MAAPYGNRNAEKWTFRKAVELFHDAIALSEQKETIYDKNGMPKEIYKFDFIGEVARELGTFHHIFQHLITRFPVLKRLHNKLLQNLESSCYYNTKKDGINTAVGIINLKSNHKWVDRVQQESDINAKINLNEGLTLKIGDTEIKL